METTSLLTPEDSKRVADALIRKINSADIQEAVRSAIYHSLNEGPMDYHKFGHRLIVALSQTIRENFKK
jgi:hypothetical protein